MKLEGDYWVDENRNKWSKSYTKEIAEKFSKSNTPSEWILNEISR